MPLPSWNHEWFGTPQAQFDRESTGDMGAYVGENLTSKDDLEALLPMSGFCRINGTGNPWTKTEIYHNRFLPLNVKVGEARGCEVHKDDGLVLNAIGQWRVDFTCTLNFGVGTSETEIRLETFDPDGELVSRSACSKESYTGPIFGVDVSQQYVYDNIIVDRPGYRVRVYSIGSGGYKVADGWNKLGAQYVYNGVPRFADVEE